MKITRRRMLQACAVATPAILARPLRAGWKDSARCKRLGVVIHSYGRHAAAYRQTPETPGFSDPLRFVAYCGERGAGGVQFPLGIRDDRYAAELRAAVEQNGMYLEGSVRTPQTDGDVDRFEAEVLTAKESGASVLRTAIGGRRYEDFDTLAAFQEFAARAMQSVLRAEPVVRRHKMRLAIENHKDWLMDDLLGMLRQADSEHLGVCVDTGNSIALLEDPLEVVRAYAPWAFAVHLKDMAVETYADGFLLAEVPLGEGFLDLSQIVRTLRAARPELQFSLEMITRDPLKIPCLTERYMTTFENRRRRRIMEAMARVERHESDGPLAHITTLARDEQLAIEEHNVIASLDYAQRELSL